MISLFSFGIPFLVLVNEYSEAYAFQNPVVRRNNQNILQIHNPFQYMIHYESRIMNGKVTNAQINIQHFSSTAGDMFAHGTQRRRSYQKTTQLHFVTDINVLTGLSEITTQQQFEINNLSSYITSLVSTSDTMVASSKDSAEAIAGPFFGLSLFPYLAFLYFLSRPQNEAPKGIVDNVTSLLYEIMYLTK
jgi:hypothetical protein